MAYSHIDITWDPVKAQANDDVNGDMPAEIDFSGAERGKFFRAGAVLRLPMYLDAEVERYLSERADAKGIPLDRLVNDLLKKDIELIEAAR